MFLSLNVNAFMEFVNNIVGRFEVWGLCSLGTGIGTPGTLFGTTLI